MRKACTAKGKASAAPGSKKTPHITHVPEEPCQNSNDSARQPVARNLAAVSALDNKQFASLDNDEAQTLRPNSASPQPNTSRVLRPISQREKAPPPPQQDPTSLPHPPSVGTIPAPRAVYTYVEPLLDHNRTAVEDTQANTTRNLCLMLDENSARGAGVPVQYPATPKPSPKNANKNVRFDKVEIYPDPSDLEPPSVIDQGKEEVVDEEFRRAMEDTLEEIRGASSGEAEGPEELEEP